MDALFPDFIKHNKAILAAMFARIRRFDITDSLSQITANTLIVNGEDDPAIPAAEAKWVARHIPDATLRIIPNCGHMFFAEAESRSQKILRDWFEQNGLL